MRRGRGLARYGDRLERDAVRAVLLHEIFKLAGNLRLRAGRIYESEDVAERCVRDILCSRHLFHFVLALCPSQLGEQCGYMREFAAGELIFQTFEFRADERGLLVSDIYRAAFGDDLGKVFYHCTLRLDHLERAAAKTARVLRIAEIGEEIRFFGGDEDASVGICESREVEVIFGR